MHESGAADGAEISGLDAVRCGHSPQMRVQRGFALAWRIHGTEAALLVPIDLSQRTFMFLLKDSGVDAPGRVS